MTWVGWTVLAVAAVVAAVAAVVALAWVRAHSRALTLNTEVLRTGAMLDRALRSRALAALELAHSVHVDPATSLILTDIAGRCLEAVGVELAGVDAPSSSEVMRGRALAESELSRGLRVIVPQLRDTADRETGEKLDQLEERWRMVATARTLHNSRVAQAIGVRNSPAGRLAGVRTPVPVTFDMDDALPEGHA
nr:hypothetical protein [Actinomycetales bacterium]